MNLRQLFLTNNDCYKAGKKIKPQGIMVHSTGANNPYLNRYLAPDDGLIGQNKYGNHWNQPRPDGQQKCVHAFIGRLKDGTIATYQTLPWDHRGWHIYPNFDTGKWIFDVYESRNLTAGQTVLPPVIFSPEFDNVGPQELVDSIIGYGNYAIVAGQGEGVEREITEIGSDATGLDKHVIFVDARDVEDSDDLPARGKTKLSEHKKVTSFQSEVLDLGPFEYENDWNVGDIVAVQNKDWGITMDARITEVTEIYEPNGFKLNVTFGNTFPTLSQKIKSALDNWR